MYTNALIVNSLIRNNTAKNGGGVAMNGTDTAIIVNSILTNNTAVDSGGAVFGAADLINCIVANNKAEEGSAAANAKLFNTVIFGNDNKDSMLFESAISYCAIDSAIVPATNIAITDAQFVKPTTFKGADTALINEVTAANWAPQQNATLLVDLGNNQDIMGVGITKDIAGKARIVHTNPLITETIVDIGAYECQIPVNEAPIVIGASVTGDTFEYGYDITMDSAFYSVTATFNGEPIPADSMTYKVTFASATDTFVAPAMLVPGTYGATIVAVEKFTGSVSYANVVTVNKADLQGLENVIATAITYGQPQTDAVLSGTAVSKTGLVVAGTLEWENPEVKPHAGTVTKDILFAPTDSNLYNNFASTGSLVVNKAAQTLTVSPANMVVSIGESKPITANASSGLSASFAANNDNVSVDSVGSVTGAKIGMSVVTVTQDGVNGGYSDYVSVSKTVTVQTISNIPATITIADTTLTFNADTQVAAISVTVGGAPVIPDTMIIEYVSTTDSTVRFGATGPTNADTYILTVIADSGIDFWGKAESEFVINPFMIAADSLVIADTAQVYSGNAAVVSVIIDSTMLPKQIVPVIDTDYKVTYSPDTVVNVGSYEVAVQFTGNYAGSDTAILVIAPFAVAADSVLITNTQQVFTGTPKSVVVTVLTIPSPSAAEYTVTYSGSSVLPIAVGSYPVAVTLSGNFTGSATATLNIISNNPYPNSAEIGIQAPGTEMVIPSNILGLPSLDKKPKTVATYTKPFGKVGAKPSKLSVKLNDYEVGADTLYLDVKGTVLLYNKKEYNSLRKTMFTQDILKSNPAIQQDSAVVTVTFSVKNVEADSNVTILMVPPTINADSIFEVSILNGTKADSYFVIYGENFGTKAKAWFEYKDLNGKMKKKGLSVVKKAMSSDGKSFVKGAKPTVQQLDSMMILKYNKIVDDPTIMRLDLTIDNKNGLDAVSVFALPLSN